MVISAIVLIYRELCTYQGFPVLLSYPSSEALIHIVRCQLKVAQVLSASETNESGASGVVLEWICMKELQSGNYERKVAGNLNLKFNLSTCTGGSQVPQHNKTHKKKIIYICKVV
jgi:hypothetical protein